MASGGQLDNNLAHISPLTTLRGIAAWWIVVYHFKEYLPLSTNGYLTNLIHSGYLAVDCFFILSGFVIALNYGEDVGSNNIGSIRRFITKRLARIYPLHLFMCLLFLINPISLAVFTDNCTASNKYCFEGRYDLFDYVQNIFLIHNIGFLKQLSWNVPSWSISTEVFAYLTFPLICPLIARHAKSIGAIALACCLIFVTLGATWWFLGKQSLGDAIPTLGLTRCVLQFHVGVLLYYMFKRFSVGTVIPSVIWLASIVFLIVMLCSGVSTFIPDYLFAPLLFAVLILTTSRVGGVAKALLALRPLVFLGTISYSTYMVHYFVRDWVKFLLIDEAVVVSTGAVVGYFVATFAASVILYQYVEKPGRHAISRFASGIMPRPASR